jgi:hypothetical protein
MPARKRQQRSMTSIDVRVLRREGDVRVILEK